VTVEILNVESVRGQARRILPRPVFDFVDGGAEDELGLRANREALDRIRFAPRVAVTEGEANLSTTALGCQLSLPILLAPCGEARLVHPDGAAGAARAAARAGTLAVVSTFCGTALEDVAEHGGGPGHWFQLYYLGGRAGAAVLIDRAREAGYRVLVITLDTPVLGKRERELRHGVSRPERLDFRTLLQFGPNAIVKPRWLLRFARAGFPLGEPNCQTLARDRTPVPLQVAMTRWEAEKPTWSDLAWIRQRWDGPIVVKGILSVTDARRAVDSGADGLVVSNHGGRQLDAAPATADVLPSVVAAVGHEIEVLFDGGVRRGSHVVRALALGARAVLIGRAYLYGLAVGGEAGVAAVLNSLSEEIARTLALIGCPSVAALNRSFLLDQNPESPAE
jgi:isopentenyl diphosphate isomerase/L-lactate dehydrogenase-like FMN-dependent dehydrogenase